MNGRRGAAAVGLCALAVVAAGRARPAGLAARQAAGGSVASAASKFPAPGANATIAESECTAATIGAAIPTSAIGEPVASVTLAAPAWVVAAGDAPAHCRVDGSMAPIDTAPTARPLNFRVVLPASWNHRSAQIGGGGNNGVIPNVTGVIGTLGVSVLAQGFAGYGSDSGHQVAGRGAPPISGDWTVNDEAIKNLGYMQLKKTHDAAMVLLDRAYGERPRFNYFFGTSQGGREALTVAQRYPADYDGIVANVPIVNFSSLMLAPELIRIQEKPLSNWVTRAKVNAIRGEFMRQCDSLDGLMDGVMNNYMACRAIFDVTQGAPNRQPWATKRCPNNVDPNPADTTASACLTDGQIATLQMVYRRYRFATPLANGITSFGMWVPNTDPSGSGLILDARVRGQEGAADNASMHTHLGVAGVTGFLMKNPAANPLDYVEGGPLNARRQELSLWLDATNPDLSAFYRGGGKVLITIGTDDTLASPGAQLDYYQSVLDTMGQATVDAFARLFVLPQTNHGLRGNTYTTDGAGTTIAAAPIPVSYDRLGLIQAWAERNVAPATSVTVTSADRSLPMCSYPAYPKYTSGSPTEASSYSCSR